MTFPVIDGKRYQAIGFKPDGTAGVYESNNADMSGASFTPAPEGVTVSKSGMYLIAFEVCTGVGRWSSGEQGA